MKTNRMIVCAVLGIGLALAGCEKSETTETKSGAASTPPAASPSTPTETAATPAASPAATPSATPADATAAAQTAAANAAGAAQTAAKTESPTTAPSGTATAAEVTQAQTLLDQTLQYVKENKMDLAEKSLTQLEGLKPKLPVEYHSKIDAARKAFNAAKTGQGLKLDSLVPGAK